ncbi:MAG TPA: AMP-binding protein [Desulfobacteria bacterium]|nr:AMP-binding protein [Desulfobacteria bacterium]
MALTTEELKQLEREMDGWVGPKILEKRAEAHPDKMFLNILNKRFYTYKEVNENANQVGHYLEKIGIVKGDRVAVLLPNCEQYVFVWFGMHKLGVVQVPVNTSYKMDFLQYAVDFSDSRILITNNEFLERIVPIEDQLPKLEKIIVLGNGEGIKNPGIKKIPLLDFDEVLKESKANLDVDVTFADAERIMFTSGTTGRSKGVFRAHAAAYWSARNYIKVCEVTENDVLFTALPLFHANAQALTVMPALVAGASVAVYDRFSATQLWNWIRDCGATVFNILGAMSYFLYNQPPQPNDADNAVRVIMAAPSPRDIYHEFEERYGIKFTEGFGMTECGMATYMPVDAPRIGTIGKAAPGYEVKVVDPDTDREMPPNTPGELVIRNQLPWLMVTEYYMMPEKTASDFRNLWFHTGDGAKMDEDGYIYFLDRIKDYIRRRAENVSSFEVEKSFNAHPAVAETAAVGVPAGEGAVAEEEIKLCVVLKEGAKATAVDLIQWAEERIPYFMIPRYIEFYNDFPKTPTERVQKHILKAAGVTANTWDLNASGYKIKK